MADPKVKISIKQSGRIRGPNLSDPKLKDIGEKMVEAQKERWAKGINADGNPARKLSVKYAIQKGAYLRKIGDPRGTTRVMRDMSMTGVTVKNFSLRKAANNSIRAENTTREARDHAGRANNIDQMIGFAGSDLQTVFDASLQEFGEYLQSAWVPIRA